MAQITSKVYSIEGITHPDPRGKVFPYVFVEDKDDLTLIDPAFISQLQILENYLLDIGYDIKCKTYNPLIYMWITLKRLMK